MSHVLPLVPNVCHALLGALVLKTFHKRVIHGVVLVASRVLSLASIVVVFMVLQRTHLGYEAAEYDQENDQERDYDHSESAQVVLDRLNR